MLSFSSPASQLVICTSVLFLKQMRVVNCCTTTNCDKLIFSDKGSEPSVSCYHRDKAAESGSECPIWMTAQDGIKVKSISSM